MRILELFSGIGGVAAAVAGEEDEIVAAVDISRLAATVYGANFPHPIRIGSVESLPRSTLAGLDADLWWLSPPCQPFTHRGCRRDLDDPRARGLVHCIDCIGDVGPASVALENVPGFEGSRAHQRLASTLERAGYQVRTARLCPSTLGLPNRRDRFYLVGTKSDLSPIDGTERPRRPLSDLLDPDPEPDLAVDSGLASSYRGALDIVDAADPEAVTACFTSAYGRSPVRSGSYLRTATGLRRFSPGEILRLLGFPERFVLPAEVDRRQAWRLVGNSLSVPAVRAVLAALRESLPQEPVRGSE